MHQDTLQPEDAQMDGLEVTMGNNGSKADLIGARRALSLEEATYDRASSATLPVTTKDDTADKEIQHPIKRACLACRARKTRCNGLDPCQHCVKKGIPCEFVASKRGGSKPKKDRVPKAPKASTSKISSTSPTAPSVPSSSFSPSVDLVDDFVLKIQGFMTHLQSTDPPVSEPSMDGYQQEVEDEMTLLCVRHFRDGEEILQAYYNEFYACIPLLPPPSVVPTAVLLSTLSPSTPNSQTLTSPLLLALLSVLSLVPSPLDQDHRSLQSKLLRRTASEKFHKLALERVESMSLQAGRDGGSQVPIEVVQALVVLAMVEWAQNGAVTSMRMRQSQALQLAMDLGLHRSDALLRFRPEDEWQREVRRQTFWMTFSLSLMGTIISNLSPTIPPFDPRIQAEYPTTSEPDLWYNHMEAIKASIWLRDFVDGSDFTRGYPPPASTQYPLFTPRSPLVAGRTGTKEERDREFERLDGVLTEQIRKSESELGGVIGGDVSGGPEQALRMNFKRSALMCQTMTLIHLHRRSAVTNEGGVGIFSKRLCGLPSSSDTLPSEQVSDMFASVTLLPGWTFPDLLAQPNLELPQSFSDAYAASLSTWTPSADAPNPVQDEVVDWPALVGWKMSSSDPIAATLAGPFMGGHSLAKVRAGVEVVARLEVLNQAVSISLQGAPTLPFCACELVGAAYCLLLLAITLQASETIADEQKNHDELNAIWTSCWALLRGLRRYGDTWDGLDGFADELAAALNASLALSGLPPRGWD